MPGTERVAFGPTTVSTTLYIGAGAYVGLSLAETSGVSSAKVRLRDGIDDTGTVIDVVTLAPNESVRDWYGPQGKRFGVGLRLEVVSGSVEGVVALI
jgi:hypothetical protein